MVAALNVGLNVPALIVRAESVASVEGGDGVVTVTIAVPDLLVSSVEVALTVRVVAVSFAPIVSNPFTRVESVAPPSSVQVTVCAGLFEPTTVALNDRVAPF
ncbi:hypothetical protein FACS1894202_14980 [Clostridia bacterium]|nr:hypothetical protein FACS1894202_14980 [Clostridia bacterium]